MYQYRLWFCKCVNRAGNVLGTGIDGNYRANIYKPSRLLIKQPVLTFGVNQLGTAISGLSSCQNIWMKKVVFNKHCTLSSFFFCPPKQNILMFFLGGEQTSCCNEFIIDYDELCKSDNNYRAWGLWFPLLISLEWFSGTRVQAIKNILAVSCIATLSFLPPRNKHVLKARVPVWKVLLLTARTQISLREETRWIGKNFHLMNHPGARWAPERRPGRSYRDRWCRRTSRAFQVRGGRGGSRRRDGQGPRERRARGHGGRGRVWRWRNRQRSLRNENV